MTRIPFIDPFESLTPFVRDYSALRTRDDGQHIVATVDLPGVSREDVSVTYERRLLEVCAKRAGQDFRYMVRVDTEVDASGATATLRDGVLTVTLPKAASALPVRIQIAN